MPTKTTKSYMVRRGRKYQIMRSPDGTFSKFVQVSEINKKAKPKKMAANKKTTSKRAVA